MGKKGQVSLFIIVGIVLLVVIGILFYINSLGKVERPGISVSDVGPVNEYVENCIKEKMMEGFEKIYENSGYMEGGIRNLCRENKYRSKKDIEKFMDEYLEDNGCDLTDFGLSRVEIEDVEIIIKDEDVIVDVKTNDIVVGKGDDEVRLNNFNVEIPLRFGELYETNLADRNYGYDSWVYKIKEHMISGDLDKYMNDFKRRAMSNDFSINLLDVNGDGVKEIGIQDLNQIDMVFKFEC